MKLLISHTLPNCMADALKVLGFQPILLPDNPRLPAPTASHADMLIYRNAKGDLLCEDEYYNENRAFFEAWELPMRPCAVRLENRYPGDIAFNALMVGKYTFCRTDATAAEILAEPAQAIHVKQGYARCSCLALPDGAILTADRSLASAFCKKSIPHLLLAPGGITLPGYDTGFIGGASGLLPDGRVIFFGSLSRYPEGKKTAAFLKEHGCAYIELCDCALYDAGGFAAVE